MSIKTIFIRELNKTLKKFSSMDIYERSFSESKQGIKEESGHPHHNTKELIYQLIWGMLKNSYLALTAQN